MQPRPLPESPSPDLRSEWTAPEGLDAQALERLFELDPDGSNKLVERVVEAYLKSLDRLLPDLIQARAAEIDLNVVRHVSHTLKSSSASLGALKASALCAEVELMARNGETGGLAAKLDDMLAELAQVKQALSTMRMPGPQ